MENRADKGELKCQVNEELGLAILSRVDRVDLIEMPSQQVFKEGEGVRHVPDCEKVSR